MIENEKYASLRIDTMLNTYKMYSPDSSVVIHNWYTNNGGTFMMHMNLAEVKLPNGKKQLIATIKEDKKLEIAKEKNLNYTFRNSYIS